MNFIKEKFTDKVHQRGLELETRVKKYLESQGILFKYSKTKGIDFIIEGKFYLDCIAQGESGTIGEKLPHKCWKYIHKYNLKDIYILHPYSPIKKDVGKHLEDLEQRLNCNIHILDWNDFTYLMNGGSFASRKPYTFVKKNGVRLDAPINMKVNKFFNFKNNFENNNKVSIL